LLLSAVVVAVRMLLLTPVLAAVAADYGTKMVNQLPPAVPIR
jgi:hypothetical protein